MRNKWAPFVIAPFLAIVLYWGTMQAGFVYDDVPYARDNPLVHDPGNFLKLWISPYPSAEAARGLYRPLTAMTFLNDSLVGEREASGFHFTNIVLHSLACLLFVGLVTELGAGTLAAVVSGAVFAVHAVHVEAVAWIVGRAEILAAVFVFASLIAWMRFRRGGARQWLVLSAASYFLACCAKETAAPLPALLIGGEYLGLFRPKLPQRKKTQSKEGAPRDEFGAASCFVAAIASYAALRITALGGFGIQANADVMSRLPFSARLLTGFASVGKYLELCLLPTKLRLFYADFRFDRLGDPHVLFGLSVFVSSAAAIIAFRRSRPLVSFWISWFAFFVYPFCNLIFPMGGFVAERFVYIGSAAVAGLAATLVDELRARDLSFGVRGAVSVAAAAWLIFLVGMAYSRLPDWRSDETLFRAEVQRSPRNGEARFNLAVALMGKGTEAALPEDDEIGRLLAEARELEDPEDSRSGMTYFAAQFNYAGYLGRIGRHDEEAVQLQASDDFLRAHPPMLRRLSPKLLALISGALKRAGLEERSLYYRSLAGL